MMVVVTITNCPVKLRGDLTRWFLEIDTGVYVGNLSSRVRDNIWDRICENMKSGKATLVYSTNGEQKLNFKIHNADWEPVDYDGITLVKRKISKKDNDNKGLSKARIKHIKRLKHKKRIAEEIDEYVCVDIETTGLDSTAQIIELAAIHIREKEIVDQYDSYIKISEHIPENITSLTGITNELLDSEGKSLETVMNKFQEFCGNYPMVGHNIVGFDIGFIQRAVQLVGLPVMENELIDTMKIARKKMGYGISLKLSSLSEYFCVEKSQIHNALDDCITTFRIYEKLKKI